MIIKRHSHKGFSLLEMSIVLGIIAVVVGGIWAIASSTKSAVLATSLEQQTLRLVDNIRNYYVSRALPTAQVVSATMTSTLRTAKVFPEDSCPANCVSGTITTIYNPYKGSTTVAVPNLTSPINFVDIDQAAVPERGCIELGIKLSSRATEIGLESYKVGSTTITTFPITLSTLDTACAATNNTLTIRFKIRN